MKIKNLERRKRKLKIRQLTESDKQAFRKIVYSTQLLSKNIKNFILRIFNEFNDGISTYFGFFLQIHIFK